MFLRSKSRFSTKNFVKLDLDSIIGKKKCAEEMMLKYYIPIPKTILESQNKIDVESTSVKENLSISSNSKKCYIKRISKKSFKNVISSRRVLNIREDTEPQLLMIYDKVFYKKSMAENNISYELLHQMNHHISEMIFPKEKTTQHNVDLKRTKYSTVSKEQLIAKYPALKSTFDQSSPIVSIEERIQDNEEKIQTWSEAYRYASYYYDNPNMKDRYRFHEGLKFNFSGILSQTENPNELPDLTNRRNLVNWVCQKHNSFLRLKNSENSIDCNVDLLLNVYGPNHNAVKSFLGAQDFFI